MAATPTRLLRAVPDPADTQQRVVSSITALADIAGYERSYLAALASIEPTALSKVLHGKRRLGADEIERLAVALGVEPTMLYEGGDELRRRAFAGLLTPAPLDPSDPSEQEIARSRWEMQSPGDVLQFPRLQAA